MPLEVNLKEMGEHLVARLLADRLTILLPDAVTPAFAACVYGEPRVITQWPMLSVQPQRKERSLIEGHSRKFQLTFEIDLYLYHGRVQDTLSTQAETHARAEAVERYFLTDVKRSFKWNFVSESAADDQVIFGFPVETSHPVIIAPEQELWSATKIALRALSQEVF